VTERQALPPGLAPGDPVRVQLLKWDGAPHWGADVVWLGEDVHGWWAGWPEGTRWARPGADFSSLGVQVALFSRELGFAATFYEPVPASVNEFRVYADVTTVPVWADGALSCVDLDLDVIERFDGAVFVDDEDEFAAHSVRYGYPSEVVSWAQAACDQLVVDLRSGAAHFAEPLAARWRERFLELRRC